MNTQPAMFLPEIYMHFAQLHHRPAAVARETAAGPRARPQPAPPHPPATAVRPNQWDDWKSVRDLA